jgi:putative colanic acid biosynthesis UDP-glucose lipid carrier transferase
MTEAVDYEGISVERPVPAAARSRTKAALDRVAALILLLMMAPLLLLVAVMIRLDSRGPILFRQDRHGRNGEVFAIYKFRTMTAAASRQSFRQASVGDRRVTRLGRILRKTSIDELPQLLNVLRGEMSLVGPRPHPIALDAQYATLIPHYMGRYAVRPGMTGLAQVSGHRGPTPTVESMAARVRLDRRYISDWSLSMDLRILLRTPWQCLFEVRHGR